MADPKALRRDQLAKFIADNETIIRFQRLFQVAGESTPAAMEDVYGQANTATSAALQALSDFNALKQFLETDVAALKAQINELNDIVAQIPSAKSKKPEDNYHHNSSARDYIDFNINAPTPVPKMGRCRWDNNDGTLDVDLNNHVTLQVGQELHYYAKNLSGTTIYNGEPVGYYGTIGASGKLEVDLAEADPAIPSEYFLGIATEDIASNDFGYITAFGLIRGIDTTGTPYGEIWNDGDLLYVSPIKGELTITAPTSPDPHIHAAVVVYAHATVGSLFVRPTFRGNLSELNDVLITGIANNDLIAWNSANSRYENTSDPIVDTISINDNAVYSGTSGEGVKVDIATPTFGWHDMLGEIKIRGIAATDPAYAVYIGGIRAYQFVLNDIVWNEFHIPHDYLPSSDLYIHVHWSHASAAVTTGSVTWSFEITYAKGYDQAPFPATKTITVTQNGSTTQYQHMIAEVAFTAATADATHFDRDDIEIDGLVLVKTELTANSLNAATDPFVHFIDIHYQSICIGSKNKAPTFYV